MMKRVLHKCISYKCICDNQSRFVTGRSILDNALVVFEVVRHMKRDWRKSNSNVALKFDISKAYNIIDWVYLKEVMLKLEFSPKWVCWILMFVEYVDYFFIVNNNLVGPIIQGVPLGRPFISVLIYFVCRRVVRAYSASREEGHLHGVRICVNAPLVFHLLFVDECFCSSSGQMKPRHTSLKIS